MSPDNNTEIELKLSAAPAVIKALAHSAPIERDSEGHSVIKHLESTYFDTPDLRLQNRGIALRVRKDGDRYVQTMKSQGEASGALLRRGEWEAVVSGPEPDLSAIGDADARELLGLILPGELRPVFTNRVRREVRKVNGFDAHGRQRMIEVAADIGDIRSAEAKEPIAEIELELVKGAPENVFDLALALHQIKNLTVETRSKSERGYALSTGALPAWHKATPILFRKKTTIGEALGSVLRGCFNHWIANQPAAIDGRDPEGVHQMRVGLRRLRSALSVFGAFFDASALEWLKAEARHAITSLGQARDLDVFLDELLAPVIEAFPDHAALATLKQAAEKERAKGYAKARAAIASPRYTEFVLRFGGWVEGGRWQGEGQSDIFEQPLITYADKLLEKRHRRVIKLGRKFESLPVEDRHRVRIALKKLRYTSEFFQSLHPGRATKRYVKAMGQLQDSLGHLNDVAVADRLVNDLVDRAADAAEKTELGMAAGLVVGWHSRGVTDSEPETVANWRGFAASTPFWHSGR